MHWPQSRSNHAWVVLLRPPGGGDPSFAADQCCCTTAGNPASGLPLLFMQTARGDPAVGCTSAEWADCMQRFKLEIEQAIRCGGWVRHFGYRAGILWSFDNDKIHSNTSLWQALKINNKNKYPLPANTPDMHKVVEHAIKGFKEKLVAFLYTNPKPLLCLSIRLP